jgi:hypothetical protein
MWKIDPNADHIHKNKHDRTPVHTKNMFVTVEPCYGTGRRKERSRER